MIHSPLTSGRLASAALAILTILTLGHAAEFPFKDFDFEQIGKIAVQHKGRVKPLDTYSRAAVSKITGRESFRPEGPAADGLPGGKSLPVLLSWVFERDKWAEVELIRVAHQPFKEEIGLESKRTRFTYNELTKNKEFHSIYRKVHAKNKREGQNAKLTRREREVLAVAERVDLLDVVFNGYGFAPIPHPTSKMQRWLPLPVADRHPAAVEAGIPQLWQGLAADFRERNADGFNQKVVKLRSKLDTLLGAMYEDEAVGFQNKIEWETYYNRLMPFLISASFYFVGLAMLLVSLFWSSKRFYWACIAVLGIGVAVQIYGFVIRIIVTERPPVSNMYESMVFMGFMLTVFAIVFEIIYRSRIFAIAAASLSVLLLILADQLPLDQGFDPLLPVLRTNYWLTVHVLTVMSAYSALTLAMGIGHINLGIYFFASHKKLLLAQMTKFLYRTLQLGFLLITAGTILGAWWAGEAWGRYWGWDPKETWALICILGYGILLHGRFANFWGPFGTAVGSVIAWSLVGMCYYGVNFVLGAGLHSYGFGDGGIQFAIGYLIVESIIVAASFFGRYFRPSSLRDELDRGDKEPRESDEDDDRDNKDREDVAEETPQTA